MNMTANSYIDSSSQKAFLKGINSCIKHIQIIQEVIQDDKQKKATVHCSRYDLTDAYRSVVHQLIEFCLCHFYVPKAEISYIMNLYSKLKGKIVTRDWVTDTFEFCRGIFTGDN